MPYKASRFSIIIVYKYMHSNHFSQLITDYWKAIRRTRDVKCLTTILIFAGENFRPYYT